MKNNQILKQILLVSLGIVLLGASPNSIPTSVPNKDPDIEEATDSPFDEEAGLELPMDQQPNQSVQPGQQPFDITQGQVDQAHGFYSHGTLVNASKFDLEGDGFMKIFVPRDRGYATYDMTQVVGIAASQLSHDYPDGERIQIGDVCAEHGGQLAHHASHQNGLDADIAYMRVNHREQDPQVITGFDELFVKNGKITENFDQERVWDFVKALHGTGRLVRIFMDPVIKATLCAYADSIGETEAQTDVLRRIRPLALHQDHMHVRITCPLNSPACVKQVDPPAGTGCADVMPHPTPAPTQLF